MYVLLCRKIKDDGVIGLPVALVTTYNKKGVARGGRVVRPPERRQILWDGKMNILNKTPWYSALYYLAILFSQIKDIQ